MRRPETEVDRATIESTAEILPFQVDIPQAELFTQELRAAFRTLRTTND